MSDGHSGIENRPVKRGGSGDFMLILSYLKRGTGQGEFVIHAASSKFYSYGLQPNEFLADIGLTHFKGSCPFHSNRCFYRVIATFPEGVDRPEEYEQVRNVHECFREFSEGISELFESRQKEPQILRKMGIKTPGIPVFGPPIEIKIDKRVPPWVDEVKFPRLLELEEEKATIQKKIDELKGFLPLLYGEGNVLRKAVIRALHFLGLDAEPTRGGFTVDILAKTKDGSKRFGLEVTGISGPLKKDSKKLIQLLEFEQRREHNEKTVLVVNTYKTMSISERKNLESFTQQALDFLSSYPILLMTSWDLYCMVRDVFEESQTREEILGILYATKGRLEYDGEK